VPGEEAFRAVHLEPRRGAVPARVGVQRLLRRAERVEQGQGRVARDLFVVPLQQELDRDGDPRRRRIRARDKKFQVPLPSRSQALQLQRSLA
jgi:hypothetical protein